VPKSKNGWSCTSTLPIRLHGVVLGWGEHRDNFSFTFILPVTTDLLTARGTDTVAVPRIPMIRGGMGTGDVETAEGVKPDHVTDSMEQGSSLLWKPKVHYRAHKIPSRVSIQSQTNLVQHNFPKIHFNINCQYLDDQGSISTRRSKGNFFLFICVPRPPLRPTVSHPVDIAGIFLGVKCAGRETDHSPLLVPGLRPRGAIPPLASTSSWCRA
jgi:hypothetical protein